ncbi:hypothetical protein SCYAM73S_08589 [Streptomyces cyaneofuscatus]
MTGHNVLHTLGFDAFGLPAEQYAVQTGTHPRASTEANMENMKVQLRRLGLGHDNRRSFATIEAEMTSGRSGSSCRSSTPGTTPRPTRPARSPSWSSSSRTARGRPPTAASGAR